MTKEKKDEYLVLLEADNAKHKQAESSLAIVIKNTILICSGCFFSYISIASFAGAFRSHGEAVIAVISAAFFGMCAGLCFAQPFLDRFGASIGNAIYMPSARFKTPPEQLSPIKGLIIEGKNDEAIEKLNEILERKPFSPAPYLMLTELYLEPLNQPQQIVEMIPQYFNNLAQLRCKRKQRKLLVTPVNLELLMIYSDTCQELNRLQSAVDLLSNEVKCKDYSVPDKNAIIKRLNMIQKLI